MSSILYVVSLCCILEESPQSTPFAIQMKGAQAAYWKGQFTESEELILSALRVFPGVDPVLRARALSVLGDVYVNEDQLAKAEQAYRESLRIYKKASDMTNVAVLLRSLGAVYSLQRRDDEALQVLKDSLKTARAVQSSPTLISQVLNSIGIVYYRQGEVSKAEKLFTEAVHSLPPSSSKYHRADLLNNLGAVYHTKRQFEKAEEYIRQALNIAEAEVGPMHPDLTVFISALGVLYSDAGRYAEAEAQYQRALEILGADQVFSTRIARLLHALSRTYAAAGRKADADAALSRAAAIARRNVAEHPDMALIMDEYAATLKKDGKAKEAEELRVEARRARVAAGLVISAHNLF